MTVSRPNPHHRSVSANPFPARPFFVCLLLLLPVRVLSAYYAFIISSLFAIIYSVLGLLSSMCVIIGVPCSFLGIIYDVFLREKLLSLGTVSESKSNIVISSVIEKPGLPLEYVETS